MPFLEADSAMYLSKVRHSVTLNVIGEESGENEVEKKGTPKGTFLCC